MNITEKAVTRIQPGKERIHLMDEEVRGFGLRVETAAQGGRKSFFWRAKINGESVFRALGEFPSVTVGEARAAAKVWAGRAAAWKQANYEGESPFAKKPRIEPASTPTFAALVDGYIENHVRRTASRPERAEYGVRWMAKRYFEKWKDREVDSITVKDVLAVKNALGERRCMANRSVEFIRTLFNWSNASEDGKINFWKCENPAKDVALHKEEKRTRFLLPEELVRFNKALEDEPHRDLKDFLVLALVTGARRGDIFSARWSDIQWERKVWTVPFPKNGESYDVQLLPAALEVLKRRRTEAADTDTYVFVGSGRDGHLMELKKPWDGFRKRAQIPDIRIHDLRRTHGSYLAIAGVPLLQIGHALGHRSLQSTEIYARLLDQSVRDARESGQRKMLEMMKAAERRKKQTKLVTRKDNLLPAANHA
jgi:integrase